MCRSKSSESDQIIDRFNPEVPNYQYLYVEEEEEVLANDDIDEAVSQLAYDLVNHLREINAIISSMSDWMNRMKSAVKDKSMAQTVSKFMQTYDNDMKRCGLETKCLLINEEMFKIEEKYENTIDSYLAICQNDKQMIDQKIVDIEYEVKFGGEESLRRSMNSFFERYSDTFKYNTIFAKIWAINVDFKAHQELLMSRFRKNLY